jgi:hypothetical protein
MIFFVRDNDALIAQQARLASTVCTSGTPFPVATMLSLLLFASPASAFNVNGGSRTRSTSLTMASKGKKVTM